MRSRLSPDISPEHRTVSIVIPVFRGEDTLDAVVQDINRIAAVATTPQGRSFAVLEIILVHDRGPDRSDVVMRRLAAAHPQIQVVWLARNSGQHAATLAGIAASRGEWIVTMDEDGQHNAADLPQMLDAAIEGRCHLVYGFGESPHRRLRRVGSRFAKAVYRRASGNAAFSNQFSSFRLVLGEIARFIAATAGPSVYLDVALSWSISSVATVEVSMRQEGRPAVSYSWRRLAQHFSRLVMSLGARPLGTILLAGLVSGLAGIAFAIATVVQRVTDTVDVPGWASLMATLLTGFGLSLIAIGVVAGYVGVIVSLLMGRPTYTTVNDDQVVFR